MAGELIGYIGKKGNRVYNNILGSLKGVLSSGGTALRNGSDFAGRVANTAAYVVAGTAAAAGYGFLSGCSSLTPGRCGD